MTARLRALHQCPSLTRGNNFSVEEGSGGCPPPLRQNKHHFARSPENPVDWRTKVEPLFGYRDALAGITRERLTLGHSPSFSHLQKLNIVSEFRYLK